MTTARLWGQAAISWAYTQYAWYVYRDAYATQDVVGTRVGLLLLAVSLFALTIYIRALLEVYYGPR